MASVRTLALLLTGAALGVGGITIVPELLTQSCEAATADAGTQPLVPTESHALTTARGPLSPTTYDPSVSLAPLVEELGPAVVHLRVSQKVDVSDVPPMMRPFIDPEQLEDQRVRMGEGSGFFISADGYLLTNNHVVADADEVTVSLSDERTFEARVIGTDENTDIALVKVDTDEPLPWVPLGSSTGARVGDRVVAIGNPFGLENTVTEGIVSAKGRVIGAGPYDDFLQTDASINPGNSGGPLFNLRGEVIGINTAINPRGQGIGFSVPIDMVKPLVDDLKDDGRVSRGWLGVGLQPITEGIAKRLGLPEDTDGAVVGQVYQGTPAADAGLKPGDVIVGLDGKSVATSDALVRAVGRLRPDEQVRLDVLRDGKKTVVKARLGERPSRDDLAQGRVSGQAPESTPEAADTGILDQLGLRVRKASEVPGLNGATGVVVMKVADGPAARALRPGDVIVEANGQRVRSGRQLAQALRDADEVALLVVQRRGAQVLIELPVQ